MSDCVGAPRMPVCRENYPFVCSTIKSPDNAPIEFAIGNGVSIRFVFLNYQFQKHQHQCLCSRPPVFTALLDNGFDHRAGTSDSPFQKHAQARLRVHRFVIRRIPASSWIRQSPLVYFNVLQSGFQQIDGIIEMFAQPF